MKINTRYRQTSYNISFNGQELRAGDFVICVFGRRLRESEIEEVIEISNNRHGYYGRSIKIKGLKNPIYSFNCIKL